MSPISRPVHRKDATGLFPDGPKSTIGFSKLINEEDIKYVLNLIEEKLKEVRGK